MRLIDGPSASGAKISATRRSLGGTTRPDRIATRSSGSNGRLRIWAAVSTVAGPVVTSLLAALYAMSSPLFTTTRRNGWPNGEMASKRREAGVLASRTPVSRCCSEPFFMVISVSARRSESSCQRLTRRSMARRASSDTGVRDGGGAMVQPLRTAATSALLRSFRAFGLRTAQAGLRILDFLGDAVRSRVERERLFPGHQRIVLEAALRIGIAKVLEDHRVFLRLLDGALELAERVGIAALLEVRPAEAIDEIPVVRLEIERLLDEADRLVQVL